MSIEIDERKARLLVRTMKCVLEDYRKELGKAGGNIVTEAHYSGAVTAMEFALELVEENLGVSGREIN